MEKTRLFYLRLGGGCSGLDGDLAEPCVSGCCGTDPLGLCGWPCCPPPEDGFADFGVGGCSAGSSSLSLAPCFSVRVNSM